MTQRSTDIYQIPKHVELGGWMENQLRCSTCGGTQLIDVMQSDAARQMNIDAFAQRHIHQKKNPDKAG